MGMSGRIVISSVLSYCSKDLKWWARVTAWLQLNFILKIKGSTPWRHEGRPTPKERSQPILAPHFFIRFFLLPNPFAPAHAMQMRASQEVGMFVSSEVLTLVCGFSFVPLLQAFPFLCLLTTAILDSFLLFLTTNTRKVK